MTRAEAKAAGLTRYFTGKPCPRGHICEKMVSNRKCIECLKKAAAPKIRAWDKKNDYSHKYYVANASEYKARALEWGRNHPDTRRSITRRRRARKAGATGTHNAADIRDLMIEQNGVCNACPADLALGFHVDHVIPLSRNGSNGPENLQLLCPTCNLCKGARTMEEWKAA